MSTGGLGAAETSPFLVDPHVVPSLRQETLHASFGALLSVPADMADLAHLRYVTFTDAHHIIAGPVYLLMDDSGTQEL